MLDYAVGLFFTLALLAFAVAFLALTGPPKRYEAQALAAAYADFLLYVEGSARQLRADFCASADAETAARAKCAPREGSGARGPPSH